MADDDEDRWLYGGGDSSDPGENKESDKDTSLKTDDEAKGTDDVKQEETSKVPPPAETSPTTTKAPADVAPPGTDSAPLDSTADDDDSDEDSEDDDVQITIGDIKSGPPAFPPYGAMKLSSYRKTNTTPSGSNTSVTVLPPKPEKTLDLEAEGTINGVGVYSFDIDSAPEKPWNKPGADITDYFNYGLNEETWKAYSEKQKKLRTENKISMHHAGFKDTTVPPGEESVKSIPHSSNKPSWSDRHRKPFIRNQNQSSGAISVIGSSISTISSRRVSDSGIKFNGSATVPPSGISTVQSGTPLVSMQQSMPPAMPMQHAGPPPGTIPVMQMSQPPPIMGQPPPGFGPPLQQTPAYHSGPPPPQPAPYMPPMNRPPPIMNRPPPPAFNNAMPLPHGGMNLGPPPSGIPPPGSMPSRIPPPVSNLPPRMPGPPGPPGPPPMRGDNWNRPPFFPNANAPRFTPRTPVPPLQGPGHRPAPSPSPGPGPSPGQPGGPGWDRPVSGFPSFQDQWSPRAPSEESDISSGSDDLKTAPKGVTPTRVAGGEERRGEYRSRDSDRTRDKERRGRYAKDNARESDKKHKERSHESHDRDKDRDRKSRDKEDRHRKRKDREEERSDGHRSSRHKRSKHSHRDSEKEDRSSSHGRDEMGKDLIIADSV